MSHLAFKRDGGEQDLGGAAALDNAFLNQTTFGDENLKREIIVLFLAQIEQARIQLAAATNDDEWCFVTHTLKGAASAVGAKHFAALAHAWDRQKPKTEAEFEAVLVDFDQAAEAFKRAISLI